MTYSIAGRCARTGMFGMTITTSSIAVGSRCCFARAGTGAVLTQHRTDPRLGSIGLDLLAAGVSARETVAALVAATPHHAWRQLAAIDAQGRTAHFSGAHITSIHAGAEGKDCVAIGNIIRTTEVPAAMARAFEGDPGAPLARRLVDALQAGYDAGGELKAVSSAALYVVHRERFAYVDLRVDDQPQPIRELDRLWRSYEPLAEDYVTRAVDPDNAPGWGELTPPATA